MAVAMMDLEGKLANLLFFVSVLVVGRKFWKNNGDLINVGCIFKSGLEF